MSFGSGVVRSRRCYRRAGGPGRSLRAWPPPARRPPRSSRTRSPTSRRRWPAATSSQDDRPLRRGASSARAAAGRSTALAAAARSGAASRSAGACWPTSAPPVLRTHDRYGNRVDEVEFDASWHQLMRAGIERELHALPWRTDRDGAHVARAAMFMLAGQAEAGFLLPDDDDLRGRPGAARAAGARRRVGAAASRATTYDPDTSKTAAEKGSAICGMAMTEKQGGSDVRANTTVAVPLNGGGPGRRVRDHRPQVVLLGADERPLPHPRPDRRGPVVLRAPAGPARRHAQRHPHPAPEGQARQPLQRLERGRVPRRDRAHGRRAGPRRADDHRDGRPHAPGLPDRRRLRDARRPSTRRRGTRATAPRSAGRSATSR